MSKIGSRYLNLKLAAGFAITLLLAQGAWAGTIGAGTSHPKPPSTGNHAANPRSKSSRPAGEISAVEQRLSSLGYWTGRVDGTLDPQSRSALIAFQKATGIPPTGRLSRADLTALDEASPLAPRERGYYHVEVDLDRQILFFVSEDGTVSNVLPISTGGGEEFTSEGFTRDAITPTGRFMVHEKISGWHKGPLGRIYYPNYILGGLAIHGYPSVPVHPASHGCVRIPMSAAQRFSEMTPVGTVVLVYGSRPANSPPVTTGQHTVAKTTTDH
jgi:N-acetylmuramoyl-L-alanine amidase